MDAGRCHRALSPVRDAEALAELEDLLARAARASPEGRSDAALDVDLHRAVANRSLALPL